MTPIDYPSTHKERYRREYFKYFGEMLKEKVAELEKLTNQFSNLDEMFDMWYAQKFPEGR
jgi:hypothetical protein